MNAPETIRLHLHEHAAVLEKVTSVMVQPVAELTRRVLETVERGGTLFFVGNGGSAADAQHLAAEYIVRFARERRPIAAIALTTDSSVLTAGANDYGYEVVFERQLQALARAGDLVIMHSTSGESENLLRAAEASRAGGVATVALLAKGGGRLAEAVDLALVVPTESTARAQEMHLTIGHIVCDLVEQAIVDADGETP